MLKFADLIEKNTNELASWESKAMGMPIQVATMILGITAEVFRCMATLLMFTIKPNPKTDYAGWTDKVPGEQYPELDGIYKVC
jgi:aldehyde dehydrogenase (NAD+)